MTTPSRGSLAAALEASVYTLCNERCLHKRCSAKGNRLCKREPVVQKVVQKGTGCKCISMVSGICIQPMCYKR
jgi:hypothetical protein